MSAPKVTRIRLTIAKKMEILDLVRKEKAKKEICHIIGIAPSSLSTLIKNEFEKNHNSSRLMLKKKSLFDNPKTFKLQLDGLLALKDGKILIGRDAAFVTIMS